MTAAGPLAESAIILAPVGRDAAVAASILSEAGIEAEVAVSANDLAARLERGAGLAVVTEEALRSADLRGLAAFVAGQPEWSDMPFILLAARGGGIERNPQAARLLEMLGNVTFLERPFHPTTLVSLARSVLRGRRRQYEARARLDAIKDAEDRLRLALSAGQLGEWELDIATLHLDASVKCQSHFGRGAGDGFTYDELLASVHPDDRAYMRGAVAHCLETGADYDVEYRCIWPDGTEHWVQVRGRLEHDLKGEPVRLVGVSHEITERRRNEEALRDFAAELEDRVEQRTREHEAMSAQLHEAQKLETLGQLTGGVAHDFNNLLTPVLGNLDLLRLRHSDDRSQRLIAGALQASERARTLVSRLLAFARRQTLEARAVDVGGLIDGIMDLVRRSLGPQIAVRVETDGPVPPAYVDPNQLELALLNLAVNARDAMPDGGDLIFTIASAMVKGRNGQGLEPGRYVTIAITDTGTGMDADTMRRAIEPFYSTKGVGKGTGLGLSMVHGLAAQSGGKLELESQVGRGTMARLWLPIAAAAARAAADVIEDAGPPLDSKTILLVDDEELVRTGTADMLTDMGHVVRQAASGAQALQMLRDERFDAVVSDYLMPGMTGVELLEEVRRQGRDLPALLITGFAAISTETAAEHRRLAKPFRRADLAIALAGLFPVDAD
jgi:signal transduction histidine kinase/DNA-binding response OmpR family regulator